MKAFLSTLVFLSAGMVMAVPQAIAQTASSANAKTTKPVAPKKAASKKAAESQVPAGADEDDSEPDITGSISVEYQCELGNKLTIYENAADDKHVALRWNKRLHRLTRVDTTTGANRFENRRQGLIWIGIPAKGILLDSKKGQQLANECKNPEQLKQNAVVTDVPGILSTPVAPAAPAPLPAAAKPQS